MLKWGHSVLNRIGSCYSTCFFCSSSDYKKRKEQKAEGAEKKQEQKPHQKKRKEKKKKKNSKVLASFESLPKLYPLLAWTKSKTSLGREHRLAWDYFSVLQFWVEILIFLATILCLPKAPQILLSAHVHLATVTLKLDNRLYHPIGFGKNTCKTVISRLRYCNPLSHISVLVVASW